MPENCSATWSLSALRNFRTIYKLPRSTSRTRFDWRISSPRICLSLPTLLRQELLETLPMCGDTPGNFDPRALEGAGSPGAAEQRSVEQAQEQVSQSQREYLAARAVSKAIHKELGESDDGQAEIDELREKLEKCGMSAEARKECDRELKRLAKMTPASAEYMVARTYLEWMTSLPWAKSSGVEEIDIPKGQAILDEDHYDLEKVKERILDYLAVKKLKPGMKGPILCFLGPPGVGKLRLGNRLPVHWAVNSCASRWAGCTMKRKSADDRRTYIGALPGQNHPGNPPGGNQRSSLHAGRSGQARTRFPGRPVGGADGSARSRAEWHFPRSLSGRAVRFVQGDVHRHGQHDQSDS